MNFLKPLSFFIILGAAMLAHAAPAQSASPVNPTKKPTYSPVHEKMNNLRDEWYNISETTGSIPKMIEAEERVVQQISALPRSTLTTKDDFGHTPLFQAVWFGFSRVTKLLLTDPSVRTQVNETDGWLTPALAASLMPRQTMFLCRTKGFMSDPSVWLPPSLTMPYYIKEDPYGAVARILMENGAPPVSSQDLALVWKKKCPHAHPVNVATRGRDALVLASAANFKLLTTDRAVLTSHDLEPPAPPESVQKHQVLTMDMVSLKALGISAYQCIDEGDRECANVTMTESFPEAAVRISLTKKGSAAIAVVYGKKSKFFAGRRMQLVKAPGLQSDWICSHNVPAVTLKNCTYNSKL